MGAASHVRRPSSATAPSLQHQLLHAPLSRFHIAVVGSAGCGKTSTIHNVSGRAVPPKHQETSGMQLMDCTWPYKTAEGAVWLLDYLFWDSGFTAAAQYKYVASTPESHAHLVLYFVSCVEKGSWSLAQKRMEEDAAKPFAKLLVLTKSVTDTQQARSSSLGVRAGVPLCVLSLPSHALCSLFVVSPSGSMIAL